MTTFIVLHNVYSNEELWVNAGLITHISPGPATCVWLVGADECLEVSEPPSVIDALSNPKYYSTPAKIEPLPEGAW